MFDLTEGMSPWLVSSRWTEVELAALHTHFPHAFPDEYRRLWPHKSRSAVENKANLLGLTKGGEDRRVFFPREYDNDVDGGYVSGLVDGEGSFGVSIKYKRGRWNFNPKFTIGLRLDDRVILEWVQTYLGCGRIQNVPRKKSPMAVFTVANLYDLLSKVVPHFEAYPLRAKKRHDFAIWQQMLDLQAAHFRTHWSNAVRDAMQQFYATLQSARKFKRRA